MATALPPCSSVVTVSVLAVHWAYSVKSSSLPCAYGNDTAVPLSEVDQPAKEYPVRLGSAGALIDPPKFAVPLFTELPLRAL